MTCSLKYIYLNIVIRNTYADFMRGGGMASQRGEKEGCQKNLYLRIKFITSKK